MKDIKIVVFWESFQFHGSWILPLILSTVGIWYLWNSLDGRPTKDTIFLCFLFSIVIIIVGFFGIYINWRLLLSQIGVASDVSMNSFLSALRRTLMPLAASLLGSFGLLGLAAKARIYSGAHPS